MMRGLQLKKVRTLKTPAMDFYPVIAKPIFVVGIPSCAAISREALDRAREDLARQFDDYHIIVYVRRDNQYDFKTFYQKDLNVGDFEAFKAEVRRNFIVNEEPTEFDTDDIRRLAELIERINS